ncbi:MAG: recombinase family protein [Sphingobacteriales bacterium JAD_PAG50586_3]|nr:MAG: recombinase family protein [Sphingobacteriales bacterium JAD_PAG50586_3]
MKKTVGIWIRVSTEDQAKGESPQNHEYRCRLFSEAREWDVKEVYHLEGVSGKSVINHPEAKRMLADVAKGHITGLVFSKLSRLGRNTKEMLELADYFRHHDASLISLGDNLDTASPSGRFFYTLLAAFGEMEREEIVSRVKGSIPARAHMGKSLGGEAPFGYKWVNNKLELDEKEAPIRKLMFELFAKHKRKMTVATILNEKGYRTRRGEEFGSTSVGRYLSDPIAKGLRRMNYMESSSNRKHAKLKPQEEWIFGEAPAIISEELWDTCHEILVSLNHGKTKTRRPGYTSLAALSCANAAIRCTCEAIRRGMYARTTRTARTKSCRTIWRQSIANR